VVVSAQVTACPFIPTDGSCQIRGDPGLGRCLRREPPAAQVGSKYWQSNLGSRTFRLHYFTMCRELHALLLLSLSCWLGLSTLGPYEPAAVALGDCPAAFMDIHTNAIVYAVQDGNRLCTLACFWAGAAAWLICQGAGAPWHISQV